MKKQIQLTFQISAVFIGTVVGAGLASGQEITQFFATYGYKSFAGILICCFMYVLLGYIIVDISLKYKLKSYNQLINLVSSGILGKVTDLITGLFLISSASIILAGSGALLHQYFGVSKWIGIIIMAFFSLITLLRDTKGLIQINSIIVPSLITVILGIFILYLLFYKDLSFYTVRNIPSYKKPWLISSLLYGGFNILCCTGVLVPLSNEVGHKRSLFIGVSLGSIGLTVLSFIINLLLLLNIPYIFKYEVPLLYVANRFGRIVQILLLSIIWCEMFSTEVSDIYSVAKTIEQSFKISYKKAIILILVVAIPISQIGFVNLITFLYPAFGVISLIFLSQCIFFYFKH